jgi:hypothetical protein
MAIGPVGNTTPDYSSQTATLDAAKQNQINSGYNDTLTQIADNTFASHINTVRDISANFVFH